MTQLRKTIKVSDELFRQVYDSPASLPGRYRWITACEDVRKLEGLLGMASGTIGAPLWVSGDSEKCLKCGRQPSWLDIVASALDGVHERAIITRVILGAQKYVNTEAPYAIAGVRCFECESPIEDLRSFKCHNWAYAFEDLERVVRELNG